MTLLNRGMHWHRDKLADAGAETVSIVAGNDEIPSIKAIPGRRDFSQYLLDDYTGTEQVFDWIVAERDLLIHGVKREPADGWRVRWRKPDGRTAEFVATAGQNSRCFDRLDQYGIEFRIHTRFDGFKQ